MDEEGYAGCLESVFLILVVIFLFGLFKFVFSKEDYNQVKEFDDSVKNSSVVIPSNYVGFGKEGLPKKIDGYPEALPKNSDSVVMSPRLFEFSAECMHLTIPNEAKGILAATADNDFEKIDIYMPPASSGAVNICKRVEHSIKIVLWGMGSDKNMK